MRMPERDRVRHTTRTLVYIRDKGTCLYCGHVTLKPHIDHIMPRASGGGHELDNLAVACKACNESKGDRILPELDELRAEVHARVITSGDRMAAVEIANWQARSIERMEAALDWVAWGFLPVRW